MDLSRRSLIAGAGALGLAGPALARGDRLQGALTERIGAMMRAEDVPGLGFGLVRSGRVVWVRGFGLADREQGRPVEPDTVFHLASVSKVVTGTAAMQLWERRLFRLDEPIAGYLDFPVVNPRHPTPITFRQLFTHTACISDKNYGDNFGVTGDPQIGLREFLAGYLAPGGKWYTPEGSYGDAEAGTRFSYSNVGTALVGYLMERIGGAPLQRQTFKRIFKPLHMRPAAWSLAELEGAALATPYAEKDGKLGPIAPIGYPDWPAGLLRATTAGMTRFTAAYAAGGALGGALNGTRILKRSTVEAMLEFQTPPPLPRGPIMAQGLFWEEIPASRPGIAGKFGGDDGAHTLIAFDPRTGHGAVMLANRSPTKGMGEAMIKLAETALG